MEASRAPSKWPSAGISIGTKLPTILKACIPRFELSGNEVALFQLDNNNWRFVSYLNPEEIQAPPPPDGAPAPIPVVSSPLAHERRAGSNPMPGPASRRGRRPQLAQDRKRRKPRPKHNPGPWPPTPGPGEIGRARGAADQPAAPRRPRAA